MGNNTFNFGDYFEQMQSLVNEKKSSARVRCLIMVCLFILLELDPRTMFIYCRT